MLKKPRPNPNPSKEEIHSSLVSLYSLMKSKLKRKSTITDGDSPSNTSLTDTLSQIDSLTLINYIKESIDVLIEVSISDQVDDYIAQKENEQQDYESILIKYENDIRGHIRVEHQLKLYADNLQYEIEQHEKEKKELLAMISKYKKHNHTNTNMITVYEKDIEKLKNELNEARKKNEKYMSIEKTLKNELSKLNDENILLNDKVQSLSAKINSYEEIKKLNVSISEKMTRKNSSSNMSTNNNNFVHKRVISTVSTQLTKRNKNSNSNNSNGMMNRSVSSYYNNSVLDSSSRSLSKKHDDLMRKINLYSKNISSSS